MSEQKKRTLIFCTAWSPDPANTTFHWDRRYRRWLDAVRHSTLEFDTILMVDDASASLPTWSDVQVIHEGQDAAPSAAVIFSFDRHLGRNAITDFPGWVRSFMFAALFAERHGFDKVVHIESDAFLISKRMQDYVNDFSEGWAAVWCPLWDRPESGVQVIAGSQMAAYLKLAKQDNRALATSVIETTLPFTHVERAFIGDRYGELGLSVPRNADFSMQTFPGPWQSARDYYWWLPEQMETGSMNRHKIIDRYSIAVDKPFRHAGANYQAVLETLSSAITPRNYFEIGSKNGHSMMKFHCDTICVDPALQLDAGVIGLKKRTFLFQLKSDDFFQNEGIRKYFPGGADLGFLDGLHLAEFLLRDFMNFEKESHERSVAILHDCLPFNARMAEREIIRGGEDEPEAQRDFWTGDVWKVVVALKKHRPDLHVFYLDCPPTGLVIVTNLDSGNRQLDVHYDTIVGQMFAEPLDSFSTERLWTLYPTLNSAALCQNHSDFRQLLGLTS